MKIYVVGSSKNNFLPLDEIREKFLIDEKHEGDNIDFLNPWYCELTGLYYLWKHSSDDIIGLEHYRTYFWNDSSNKPISENEIKDNLSKYDIICGGFAFPWLGRATLYDDLNANLKGHINDLINVVKKIDPKFSDYLEKYLHGTRLWSGNMFIGKRKIIDDWLITFFDIAIEFEKSFKLNDFCLRREGFIGEFLFGAWLEYKGYKIKQVNIRKFNRQLTSTELKFNGVNCKVC